MKHAYASVNGLRLRTECPVCGSSQRHRLFTVDNHVFATVNETIDQAVLERTGLLDLPGIDLMRCKQCGVVYTEKLLDNKNSQTFWGKVYLPEKSKEKVFNITKRKTNLERWNQMYAFLLDNCLQDGETVNVLDVGCGWADFLITARAPGVRTIGIEHNQDKARYARDYGIEIYSSVSDIPEDIVFKAFHADQILEHLENPVHFMESIMPRLHKDFVGYVSVPNYPDTRLSSLQRKLEHGELVRDKDLITWDHLNYFSPQSFAKLLARIGFEAVDIETGIALRKPTTTSAFVRVAHAQENRRKQTCKGAGERSRARSLLRRIFS